MFAPKTTAPDTTRPHPRPVIFGCAGMELTPHEEGFFRDADPFGFIVFKRNCSDPEQLRRLIRNLRMSVDRPDAPVLIDQEGGRVARLQPPHWPKYPAAREFGAMYERDAELAVEAIKLYARIVAHDLTSLGITVNCAPVLDLRFDGATNAIGDRALSSRPTVVAALARVWAETFLAHGVLPVIKHFPGHGRLTTDPHHELPVITASLAELESEDFIPFELLKDLPLGMNSHAIFKALDPLLPASLSSLVHQDIIRGRLGFDGLLLSDDLTMKALKGLPANLAQAALAAGSDIALHCNGVMEEMQPIAAVLDPMPDESWARWTYALSMLTPPDSAYRPADDSAQLDILLGGLAFNEKG